MKEESKEAITKHLYSILLHISFLLKYKTLDNNPLNDAETAIKVMQYDLDDVKKLLEEEKAVKDD